MTAAFPFYLFNRHNFLYFRGSMWEKRKVVYSKMHTLRIHTKFHLCLIWRASFGNDAPKINLTRHLDARQVLRYFEACVMIPPFCENNTQSLCLSSFSRWLGKTAVFIIVRPSSKVMMRILSTNPLIKKEKAFLTLSTNPLIKKEKAFLTLYCPTYSVEKASQRNMNSNICPIFVLGKWVISSDHTSFSSNGSLGNVFFDSRSS